MITKQDLLELAKKEYTTTVRMLKAFPAEKGDFKPHERSQEAVRLASTFIFEMYLCAMHLFGDIVDRSKFQNYKPANMDEAIKDFEKESADMIARLEALPEKDLEKTVEFAGKKFLADKFALMMICDQIHHRGQLSVYVRMAGGKVPSIYGPSADDPGTNF
jgi:uncharacterized damage-inducible protein DinB